MRFYVSHKTDLNTLKSYLKEDREYIIEIKKVKPRKKNGSIKKEYLNNNSHLSWKT